MTTLIVDENIQLKTNHFGTLQEVLSVLYEELLEQKMQYAKSHEVFIDF
ncbi:MAG: hypothetical protein WCJ84_03095 [Candidatus Peregrinibacteria bacterium]